jgi:hypothetical protein
VRLASAASGRVLAVAAIGRDREPRIEAEMKKQALAA